MGILSKIFGLKPKVDIGQMLADGAIIVDVRTKQDVQAGHNKNAINIPLDQLEKGISKISKDQAIITCCASGIRSSAAKGKLIALGYNVENGGGWMNLRKY